MKKIIHYIGLDVHKESIPVTIAERLRCVPHSSVAHPEIHQAEKHC